MTINDIADRGFPPALAAVDALRIPGVALGVIGNGARAVRVAGRAQIEPSSVAMTRATWFDLASLTKVIFTTTVILKLAESGRIALDDPLTKAIPDLRQYDSNAAERRLSFRQCLAHQTHLPAVEPLYSYGQNPATLRSFILQREWRAGPPLYSDINFMLLGIAIERLTGKTLGDLAPPGFSFAPDPATCAATENCAWRGQVMRGRVHDENAYALGGAAGHAGLFGSIDAVLDFAGGLLDGSGLASASLAAIKTPVALHRTVGWQIRHDGWSGGDACADGTIGHTGFTGTGLWLDFSRGIAWALLTNRVHPSRHNDSGITTLRRAVGDAVIGAAAALADHRRP